MTIAAAPVPVYSGPLAQLPELSLAALSGGAPRRYRFRVSFPAGAGDNDYQGASLSTGFVWTGVATEAAAPTPAPDAPAPPAATPPARPTSPTPVGSPAAARLVGLPAARRCVKRRRYGIKAKPQRGVRVKSVTVYVDGRRGRGARKAARRRSTSRRPDGRRSRSAS